MSRKPPLGADLPPIPSVPRNLPLDYTGPIRIVVKDPAGVHHLASGQRFWEPGEYLFHVDPKSRGWLHGQHNAGRLQILGPPETETPAPEKAFNRRGRRDRGEKA